MEVQVLRKFAQDHQLHVVDEYVDDGRSGTNFERPAFQRMMDDVDAGKITCIVVKDLSRFGREHVTLDFYLEYFFPEKQVRFIAVAENEDTERGLSDFVPFKNLFNEWYAKDTSRKVKTALHAKHAAGERTYTYAPLGYMKDPDRRNHLTEYNFTMLSEKYQEEQQSLTEQITQLKEAQAADRQTTVNASKWLELIKRYANPTELNAEMLNELIEFVWVEIGAERKGKIIC